MSMARVALWFLIAAASITLFGCGHKESKEGPRKLLMWLVGSESQAKAVQVIGEDFFKNKNVRFRCEAVSWGDAHTKYLTSIAGDVVPDIGTMGLTWGTEFGNLGAMVDLSKEFPQDLQRIKGMTFSGLCNSIDYKGKTFGVPFDMSMQIMFYRKDIITRPPATWSELADLLKNLKTQGKGMIFDWGSISWIGYAPYLWQAGGDFYNQEGTRSILGSKESADALKFFASLYTDLGVPRTSIPLEQGMRIGDFPLAISGTWKIDSLRLSAPEIKGKWSISLLPAGPTGKHTAFVGGRIMGIFTKSKNKDIAWDFIKFLFTTEAQVRLYEAARETQDSYLPSNILTWDILPMEAEFKDILRLQAQDTKGPPPVLGWDESTRFIEEAIQMVVLQGSDAAEQLSKASEEMDRYIRIER